MGIIMIIRKLLGLLFSKFRDLLQGRRPDTRHFIDFTDPAGFPFVINVPPGKSCTFNNMRIIEQKTIRLCDTYQYDNVIDETFFQLYPNGRIPKTPETPERKTEVGGGVSATCCAELWETFIATSKIPAPWRNEGFHYSCFVLDENRWSSPSWIWTNAAIGRYYSMNGKIAQLSELADHFLQKQLACGGWVVRYDFKGSNNRLSQTVAPNDSAYICSNTLLPAFVATGEDAYLQSAIRCADWIMNHGHDEFLIRIGYELETASWDTSANIVDIGFSADLFVKLFQLTEEGHYLDFASRFIERYLSVFYLGRGRLATAIDGNLKHRGTAVFTRGHAWALEGLIPYFAVTRDEKIRGVIDNIVALLIKLQRSDGSWLHLHRPGPLQLLSGPDCKGTPVVAYSLVRWSGLNPLMKEDIRRSVSKALLWSMQNTATRGIGAGGIFSWNSEGALAGRGLTSAACVYSSAYAAEIVRNSMQLSAGVLDFSDMLKKIG